MSSSRIMFSGFSRASARLFSSTARQHAATPTTYPFSKTALIPPPPAVKPSEALQKGVGLMQHMQKNLWSSPERAVLMEKLLNRKSPEQLRVGSVVTIQSAQAPYNFSGVLLAIRRRGPDSSIRVRNILQRTGTELQFFLNNPHIKEIKVVRPPPRRYMRRAKLFYLRDAPDKMTALAGRK